MPRGPIQNWSINRFKDCAHFKVHTCSKLFLCVPLRLFCVSSLNFFFFFLNAAKHFHDFNLFIFEFELRGGELGDKLFDCHSQDFVSIS